MTNTQAQQQQSRHYQVFLGAMDEREKIATLLAEDQNGVDEKRARAFRDIRDYVWSSMTDEQRVGLTREALDNKDNQHIQQMIQKVLTFQTELSRATAATTFYRHLEQIVEHEMSEKTLEKLLYIPEVRESIKAEYRAPVSIFVNYQDLNDFMERYIEKGKAEGKREQQMEAAAALKGVMQAARERFKEWSPQIQEFAAAVEASTMAYKFAHRTKEGDELIRAYALPGIELQAKEAKEAYEKAVKDGRGIHTIMRDTLKSMKELPQKEFEKLYTTIYVVERGKLKTVPRDELQGYDAGMSEE